MIDERARHELFLRLEGVLGAEEAATLMEHLPPVGWADVATKHNLEALRVATKQEIELLRVEMKHEFGLVRAEMGGIRTDLGGEITGVRAELAGMRNEFGGEITGVRAELAGMRNEFDGEITGVRAELAGMRNEFVTQAMLHAEINRLLLWLFPTLLTALALVFAVAKLS